LLLLVAFNNSSSNVYLRSHDLASLGLPPTASDDEIKKSCRKMLGKAHPDRKGGNAETFIKVSATCERLKSNTIDIDVDDIFEKWSSQWEGTQEQNWGQNWEEFTEEFFRNYRQEKEPSKPYIHEDLSTINCLKNFINASLVYKLPLWQNDRTIDRHDCNECSWYFSVSPIALATLTNDEFTKTIHSRNETVVIVDHSFQEHSVVGILSYLRYSFNPCWIGVRAAFGHAKLKFRGLNDIEREYPGCVDDVLLFAGFDHIDDSIKASLYGMAGIPTTTKKELVFPGNAIFGTGHYSGGIGLDIQTDLYQGDYGNWNFFSTLRLITFASDQYTLHEDVFHNPNHQELPTVTSTFSPGTIVDALFGTSFCYGNHRLGFGYNVTASFGCNTHDISDNDVINNLPCKSKDSLHTIYFDYRYAPVEETYPWSYNFGISVSPHTSEDWGTVGAWYGLSINF